MCLVFTRFYSALLLLIRLLLVCLLAFTKCFYGFATVYIVLIRFT